MIDINKKYQTRKGAPVRILCVDREGNYPVVGLIGENVYSWSANGQITHSPDWELVEIKERHKITGFIFSRKMSSMSDNRPFNGWTHTFVKDQDTLDRCISAARVDGRPYAWAPVDLEADIHGY